MYEGGIVYPDIGAEAVVIHVCDPKRLLLFVLLRMMHDFTIGILLCFLSSQRLIDFGLILYIPFGMFSQL